MRPVCVFDHAQCEPIISGSVHKAVSSKVRKQQVVVRNLDRIGDGRAALVDVVAAQRQKDIKGFAGLYRGNLVILAVPILDAGVRRNQMTAASSSRSIRHHRCRESSRNASHNKQKRHQDRKNSAAECAFL